ERVGVCTLKLPLRKLPQFPGYLDVYDGLRNEGSALNGNYLCVGDRLGRERALLPSTAQAERLSSQIEIGNQTAPIEEDFVGTHAATDDVVEVVGGFFLAVDHGFSGKRNRRG